MSTDDVSLVFSAISSDKKKITREDMKVAMEKYFPNMPPKIHKLLFAGKEEVTRESLMMMLLTRGSSLDFFEEAFQLFEPNESGYIPDSSFKQLLREINTHHLPYKGNIAAIKARFDRDRDGEIGLEDFKKMNMR
ncbi:hypothetical protein HK101_010277 [Irineochytrium annulatum]|nr:hypothetical protein HK101_010277 [Irineochytrium annulatum]